MAQTLPQLGRELEGLPSNTLDDLPFIPKERYTSRDFAASEAKDLWPRVWQMACREEDISRPGYFFEYRVLDQSIIVVRQKDGSIRAFHNVCSHRGMPLVEGSGHVSLFRCVFHAWKYDLDGSLLTATSPDEFPCSADYSLPEVRVDTWGGFVFVNLNPDCQSLADYLDAIPDALAPYHFEEMSFQLAVTCVFPCNWKAALEAFLEAYHVNGTHPQLLSAIDDVNSLYENVGIHSRMVNELFIPSPRLGEIDSRQALGDMINAFAESGMELPDWATAIDFSQIPLPEDCSIGDLMVGMRRGAASVKGIDLSDLTDEQLKEDHSWLLFPNFILQCNGDEVLAWRALPNGDDAGSCLLEHIVLRRIPRGQPHEPVKRQFYDNWRDYDCGFVIKQDFENLERLQVGLNQRAYRGVLFGGRQDSRCRHLHRVLDQYLQAGKESVREHTSGNGSF